MTQEEALTTLKLGYNVFLTGAPGAGKTYLLNKYIAYLKEHLRGVAVTASTGIAATHMNGTTIHSWCGMGIKDNMSSREIKKLMQKSYLKKHFKENNVLIIDEASMMSAAQFDLVDKICQSFKGSNQPFGGMQVVCSGDLFQLPPIEQSGGGPKFFVESVVWREMDATICYLEEQHRQGNDDLLRLLNHIRANNVEDAQSLLAMQDLSGQNMSVQPTKLFAHNVDVDRINNMELAKITEQKHAFIMEGFGNHNLVESLMKNCLSPETLILKKSAQVMFVKNNFEKGYVNGTRGVIDGFSAEGLPRVLALDGKTIEVEEAEWGIEEDGEVLAQITQIPLRLAWAITVHKSQGMSLDCAEIDLSKTFVEGMGYVALSRLRTLAGLRLLGINEMAFRVSPAIVEFDKELKRSSEKMIESLKMLTPIQIKNCQEKFLDMLPIVGSSKKIKSKSKASTSTYEETKELLNEHLSIEEIAKTRGISEETVISHIEKIIKSEKIDLEYLKPEKSRLEKVRLAFAKTGENKLSPVKEILGDDFTYREIKIARLFL